MLTVSAVIDPAFAIGPVPPRLFGSFVEHMGRCVYGGIYEPGHSEADVDGVRLDVVKLTRELGVTAVRYPGGNFVSNYRWEDGVGPVSEREPMLDLAWRSIEPNTFGLNEFMNWARQAEVEPIMAVNLGTRGVEEACQLLEYANFPGGTRFSDLRRSHGVADPYGIKMWCLGNEMDGPWQMGAKTAVEYGRLAAETGKAMRRIDPSIELVACGSSNERMPTFGSWEAQTLEECYDVVDFISLHAYFEQHGDARADFLASGVVMDRFIEGVIATADHIGAKRRSSRKLQLSFDEWNIWQQGRFVGQENLEWSIGPRLIEDDFTVEDAVVFGSLLISLLRHGDRVTSACLAQLVNVIAPIRTEPDTAAWRQTIFFPFALTARHARGQILRVEPLSPLLPTAELGDVPAVDVLATHDADTGETTVFAVNRSDSPASLDLRLGLPGPHEVIEHVVLGGTDLTAANTKDMPNRVAPRSSTDHHSDVDAMSAQLPPVSWTMLRLGSTPPTPQPSKRHA